MAECESCGRNILQVGFGKIFFDITIIFVLARALSAFCVCVWVSAESYPQTATHTHTHAHMWQSQTWKEIYIKQLPAVRSWREIELSRGETPRESADDWVWLATLPESVPGRQTRGRQILGLVAAKTRRFHGLRQHVCRYGWFRVCELVGSAYGTSLGGGMKNSHVICSFRGTIVLCFVFSSNLKHIRDTNYTFRRVCAIARRFWA